MAWAASMSGRALTVFNPLLGECPDRSDSALCKLVRERFPRVYHVHRRDHEETNLFGEFR